MRFMGSLLSDIPELFSTADGRFIEIDEHLLGFEISSSPTVLVAPNPDLFVAPMALPHTLAACD